MISTYLGSKCGAIPLNFFLALPSLLKYERCEAKLYDSSGLAPSVPVKHAKTASVDILLFTYSKYPIVSRRD